MFQRSIISCLFFFIFSFVGFGQNDSLKVKSEKTIIDTKSDYNPLSPSKAAFFSAIFPGGGQIYNKKYWKVPLAWAAVGVPTYFYLNNNSEYKRYRRAFKLRRAGLEDEFTVNGIEIISEAGLERAQRTLRGNRDLSLLFAVLGYVTQIVEASVNAHLLQFDASDNLSMKPVLIPDPIRIESPTVGLRIKYSF